MLAHVGTSVFLLRSLWAMGSGTGSNSYAYDMKSNTPKITSFEMHE